AFGRRGGIAPRLSLVLAAVVFACALAGSRLAGAVEAEPPAMPGGLVVVSMDRARIIKLPAQTATLVIGNPLIADAAVQPGGIAVLTAKSYGATNIIALDRNGSTLFESPVQVVGPADKTVVVYRGIDRETYSCVPNCERRTTIGDTPNYFNANLNQIGT